MNPPSEMDRLASAIEAWLRFRQQGGSAAAFLAAHESLRDLLEPMLAGESDAPAAHTGDPQGRVLGDFRLLREIGRGGMGVVFEAWQLSLDRRVAVKVLPPHIGQSPRAIARFKREASTAARLDHPGIVKVFAVGVQGDVHFLAMELVDGQPLDRTLAADRSARSHVEAVAAAIAEVADALEHAHRAGVTHRDVKPSNVLVRSDGRVVLTDFGLAMESGLPSLSMTGEFAGTPYYVSPEQAQAKRAEIDHRSDVFSLGVTLYELLTGQRPFGGETSTAVLQAIVTSEPRDPQRVNPELAADLAAIVMKAIEKAKADRYQSAAALAQDLRDFLAYRPVLARRPGTIRRLRRWVRREPLKAALASVLALGVPAMAILAGYLLSQRETIALGEQARIEDRRRALVFDGYRLLANNSGPAAAATFRRAIGELGRDPDLVVGLAVALLHGAPADPRAALEVLAGETEPELEGLRRLANEKAAGLPSAQPSAEDPPPHSASGFYIRGMIELARSWQGDRRKSWQEALPWFERAVLASPQARPAYHVMRARSASYAGDAPACLAGADALLSLWPDDPGAQAAAALSLESLQPARALSIYRRLADEHAESAEAWFGLGRVQYELRQLADALASLQRAADLDPANARLVGHVAKTLMAMGKAEAAQHKAKEALGRDPDQYTALFVLGQSLAAQGLHQEAIPCFERCIALDEHDWQPFVNLGAMLINTGKADAAVAVLERAVREYPACIPAATNLALALRDLGREHDGMEVLRKQIARGRESAFSWRILGELSIATGDASGGHAAFERALALAPRDAALAVDVSGCLMLSGRFDLAAAILRTAIAAGADSGPVRLNLAAALINEGRWAEAREHFLRAVELEPALPEAHEQVARYLLDSHDHPAWRAELQRWAQLGTDASRWRAAAEAALTPADAPDPELAVRAARRAVELLPADGALQALLSDALAAAGERGPAAAAADEALRRLGDAAPPALRARLEARSRQR